MSGTRTPRASVVIPIYNVEEYLAECIDSVVEQSIFSDLEVILVNDGSTDSSGVIAAEYASKHANIQLINKVNGGLGAARNTGVKAVSSRLVTFLDSDDIIPAGAYERMVGFLETYPEVDAVAGQMESFPAKQKFYWQSAFVGADRAVSSLAEVPTLVHSASACNKMFRVDRLLELGGEFPEGVHFEDAPVVVPFMLRARSIGVIADVVYLYRKRAAGGSIMDSMFTRPKNYADYLSLIERVSGVVADLPEELRPIGFEFCVRGFQGFLLRAPEVLEAGELEEFYRRAGAVFRNCPTSVIERHTLNPRHRYSFGLLSAMRQLDEYPLSAERDTRLRVRYQRPMLGHFDLGRDQNLLAADSFVASAESITLADGCVVVEGRVSARGIPIVEQPKISLNVELGRRSFEASWVRRPDRASTDGEWSGFMASIPLSNWPKGEYFPRLRFATDVSSVTTRMMKTAAFFRNSRETSESGVHLAFVVNASQNIGVRRGSVSRSGLRGTLGPVVRAAKMAKAKKPLAKWVLLTRALDLLGLRRIWLIGERYDTAQDNGAALFRYLRGHRSTGRWPVYVVEKGTDAYRAMRKFGTVVPHGSLRHRVALCAASTMIDAFDVDTYLIPTAWNKPKFIEHYLAHVDTKRVFLQHGVIYRNVAGGQHRLVQGYDLFLASTRNEHHYLSTELDYGDRTVLTGLPRFDTLLPRSERTPARPMVVFAPTWREGLVRPSYQSGGAPVVLDGAMESPYMKTMRELTESEALETLIRRHHVDFKILPHHEAKELVEALVQNRPGMSVADLGERSFQDWLNSADIYATDYSSTMFDAARRGVPILHLVMDGRSKKSGEPFDRESYFSLDRDGFGPVADTVEEFVADLETVLNNGLRSGAEYQDRVEAAYQGAPDQGVSATVVRAIENLVG